MEETTVPGIKVFVYGTLKEGFGNHARYLADAELLGKCSIQGRYTMIDLGFFPAVVRDPDAEVTTIHGEVYRISEDTLAALDLLEGHPTWYSRLKINTPWKKAWCYFMPVDHMKNNIPVIPEGKWPRPEEESDDGISQSA